MPETIGSEEEYSLKQTFLEIGFMWLLIGIMAFALPLLFLLRSQETFASYFDAYKWNLYIGLGLATMLTFLAMAKHFTHGRFEAIIHSPSQSVLGKWVGKVYWIRNPIRLYFVGMFFAFWYGLFAAIYGKFLAIAPTVKLQISPFVIKFFSAEPTAIMETMLYMGVLSIVSTLIITLLYKFGKGKINRTWYNALMLLILLPIGVIVWYSIHLLAYGGQALSLGYVILFGILQMLAVLFTFSFIPAYTLHFQNNYFLSLSPGWGSYINWIYVVVYGIILTILFIWAIRRPKK